MPPDVAFISKAVMVVIGDAAPFAHERPAR